MDPLVLPPDRRVDRDFQFQVKLKPQVHETINLSPIHPIAKNQDGTGGGIRCRSFNEKGDVTFVDIVWGETTEIEVLR